MDIASIRKEYLQGGLRRCQMPDDPLVVFEEWLGEAVEARLVEPTAMVVATVSQECRPSTRTVLLKGLEEGRFVFFTNYESRKGQQIETNPCVSLSFCGTASNARCISKAVLSSCPQRSPMLISIPGRWAAASAR